MSRELPLTKPQSSTKKGPSDEEQIYDSEDGVSDIENVEQGHGPCKSHQLPSESEGDEEDDDKIVNLGDKFVVVNGVQMGLWDYLDVAIWTGS